MLLATSPRGVHFFDMAHEIASEPDRPGMTTHAEARSGVVDSGALGWAAIADAQAPSPAAAARFDGTYAFVSSTKANATYLNRTGRMATCVDQTTGLLTIAKGRAQYTTSDGVQLDGTVGPQGTLAMRSLTPPSSHKYLSLDFIVSGNIDSTGTARARQTSNWCTYDFVWQKAPQ